MGDAEGKETLFIVASADAAGAGVITDRISRELEKFDNVSRLNPTISSSTLLLAVTASEPEQLHNATVMIQGLIDSHLLDKEKLK